MSEEQARGVAALTADTIVVATALGESRLQTVRGVLDASIKEGATHYYIRMLGRGGGTILTRLPVDGIVLTAYPDDERGVEGLIFFLSKRDQCSDVVADYLRARVAHDGPHIFETGLLERIGQGTASPHIGRMICALLKSGEFEAKRVRIAMHARHHLVALDAAATIDTVDRICYVAAHLITRSPLHAAWAVEMLVRFMEEHPASTADTSGNLVKALEKADANHLPLNEQWKDVGTSFAEQVARFLDAEQITQLIASPTCDARIRGALARGATLMKLGTGAAPQR